MKSDRLDNIHGLARRLNIPTDWILKEARAGRIPSLQIGRKRLFNVDAVRARLAERAAAGEPERAAHA